MNPEQPSSVSVASDLDELRLWEAAHGADLCPSLLEEGGALAQLGQPGLGLAQRRLLLLLQEELGCSLLLRQTLDQGRELGTDPGGSLLQGHLREET